MIWMFQSFFGLFVDATMGQLVRALSGGAPSSARRISPWNEPPWPAERSLPAAPFQPLDVLLAPRWEPAAPEPALEDRGHWRDRDLDDDDVKLVRYTIVSVRRCHERVLESGEAVVTESMTREGFAAWRVADYLSSGDRKIGREDARYLRVNCDVLERWPRQKSSGCKEGETEALRGILETLRELHPGKSGPSAPQDLTPRPPLEGRKPVIVSWDGSGTPSQVQAQGHVTLTKRWNGTNYDVTLDGTLSVRSRSYGYVRHALPPGYLPVSDDPRDYSCAVQRHATLGDTSAIDNYGGRGVHVRRGDFPGFAGRATLWFPELYNGTFTLLCTWQTDEP
jgi:hypothetical protein